VAIYIMWHVDPLLGNDREMDDRTVAVARQRPANNRGIVFSARSPKQKMEQQQMNGFFFLCSLCRDVISRKIEAIIYLLDSRRPVRT
jgi:hypothetical protein